MGILLCSVFDSAFAINLTKMFRKEMFKLQKKKVLVSEY